MAEGPYPIGRCNGQIVIWIRTIVRIERANLSREMRHVFVLHC